MSIFQWGSAALPERFPGRAEEIRPGEGRQAANMYQAEESGLCAGEGSGEPLEAETWCCPSSWDNT